MGDNKQRELNPPIKKRHFYKSKWVIGAFILIIIVGVGATTWLFISTQEKSMLHTHESQTANQTKTEAEARADFNNVDKLVNTNKIDEAKAAYDELIKNTSDPNQKAFLLLDKATLYLKDSKYDEALTIAREAENYAPKSSGIASYIAHVYLIKGDTQNAILYYKKAISLVDKTDPMSSSDVTDYQNMIKSLGGTI